MDQGKIGRPVGIHIRLQQGLLDIVDAVSRMKLPAAQSFLLNESGKYVSLSHRSITQFVAHKEKLKFLYFVHAAYWSSMVHVGSQEFASLLKEAELARRLTSDGIVIHVGATRARLDKKDQISYVAEALNELLLQVTDIPLILENSPHAGRNVGGDFMDFALLLEKVEVQNRVRFCIDTAHASVFGYDLISESKRRDFFKLLENVFEPEQIALLHLNDTDKDCGSFIDRHILPGDGMLGKDALTWFMHQPLCKNVPIIIEPPVSVIDGRDAFIVKEVVLWDGVKNFGTSQ